VEIPDRPVARFAVCEVLKVASQPHHCPWVDTQVRTVEAQLLNEDGGGGRLIEHVGKEEVGDGGDLSRGFAGAERCGPQDGRGGDGDRRAVERSRGVGGR